MKFVSLKLCCEKFTLAILWKTPIIHCMSFYSLFLLFIRNIYIHVLTVFRQKKTENENTVLHMHFGKLKRTDEKILNF